MNNRQSNVKQEWGQCTDWYLDGIPIAFFETVTETPGADTDQPKGKTIADNNNTAQAEQQPKQ